MKILVGADVPPDPDSGAAGTVVATNAALRALGHDVEAFWSADLSHRIRHWNLHYLLELPREYRREVARRCETDDFDVIQLSQPHAWLAAKDHRRRRRHGVFVNRSHGLESLAEAALAEWHRRLGIPESRFPRSLASPLLRRRLRGNIDRVARFADGMLVPAHDIKAALVERHGADPARIAVVPHGIPDAFLELPPAVAREGRERRMLYVGQYSMLKGPWLLAEAVHRVLSRNPGASMTWVCARKDHERVLAHFPKQVRARVRMLDWMPQAALIELLDDHAIHLAHSIYEGAAKSCTEAMARGQAVIGSAVGALKDIVESGNNGILVEVGDTEAMASAAEALLFDTVACRRMGEAARASVAGLSWERCASEAITFYGRLLDMRGEN